MSNRAARRNATRATRHGTHEVDAYLHLAMRGRVATVPVSHAAAARALGSLSPAALRLVWGMVTIHSQRGGGECIFADAVKSMGGRNLPWQVIEELHAAGLLRFTANKRHELHPLLGSIAHRLHEFAHDGGVGVRASCHAAAAVFNFAPRGAAG